jgi:DNA-binding CsgD family transcriptional regulator
MKRARMTPLTKPKKFSIVPGERTQSGGPALGHRKLEILRLVAKGLTNAQIAKRLFLSESTIKQYLRAAYKVLGVKNRTEAAQLFQQRALERTVYTPSLVALIISALPTVKELSVAQTGSFELMAVSAKDQAMFSSPRS